MSGNEAVWIGHCDLCNGQHCVQVFDPDTKIKRSPHQWELAAALRMAQLRLSEAGHAAILIGDASCCDSCDRAKLAAGPQPEGQTP